MKLEIKTRAQFMALVDALNQYVGNTEEAHEYEEPGAEDLEKLAAAAAYRDQLDTVLSSTVANLEWEVSL